VRSKPRRKYASMLRVVPAPPTRKNERWALDFVVDSLVDGRRFRALTVIDVFTRECLAIEPAQSIRSPDVTRVLDLIIARRGQPEVLTMDNGTEFRARHFDGWAYALGIKLDFIRPGRAMENGYVESFNGKLRDECLEATWFESLDEARQRLERWRHEYNHERPHSALNKSTPAAYAAGGGS
jgi:putative transposase